MSADRKNTAVRGGAGRSTLGRLARATVYSWQGLKAAWRHEQAFREEVIVAGFLLPAGWFLGESAVERVLLYGSVGLVLIVELLNSALEAALDRQGTRHDPLAGRAKDMGSAAVFLALILVVMTWGLIVLT